MNRKPVAVLGAGSWGTALAMVLSRTGREVRLLARSTDRAATMEGERENRRYLAGIRFPDALHVTADIGAAIDGIGACVVALPCQAAESVLPALAEGDFPVVAAFKGLHPETLVRTDEVLLGHLPPDRVAVLSGPSFAQEVAKGQPTAITLAAANLELAGRTAAFFDDTNFRVYSSDDLTGVAMGGALKNVIAIAAGVAEGLGLGHNSVAAAVTRGLAEMARLTVAVGGQQATLMGLSGLGDLVLTCTGSLSRNRRLGIALAQGMDVTTAIHHIGQVVEGVRTAEAAHLLAAKLGIEVPLMSAVHGVLKGRIDIRDAIGSLMSRPERSEFD